MKTSNTNRIFILRKWGNASIIISKGNQFLLNKDGTQIVEYLITCKKSGLILSELSIKRFLSSQGICSSKIKKTMEFIMRLNSIVKVW